MNIDLSKITTNFCVTCLKSVNVHSSVDRQGYLKMICEECQEEEIVPLGDFHEE